MHDTLRAAADEAARIGFIATVNSKGLVQISIVTLIDITPTSIVFSDRCNSPIQENILINPKAALSFLNPLNFHGFQVKGLTKAINSFDPVTEEGHLLYDDCRSEGKQVFELQIAQVFDLLTKENKLIEPIWANPELLNPLQNLLIEYPSFTLPTSEPKKFNYVKTPLSILIKNLFQKKFPGFIGTLEANGTPNLSPRFILDLHDNYLLWGDQSKNKTYFNLSLPSPTTVFFADWESLTGFECHGWVEFRHFGDSLLSVSHFWKHLGLNEPIQAVHFHPEEIIEIDNKIRTEIWVGSPQKDWLKTVTSSKKDLKIGNKSVLNDSKQDFSFVRGMDSTNENSPIKTIKPDISDPQLIIRSEFKSGDIGHIIFLHGAIYAREYQFNMVFEAQCAVKIGQFVQNYNPHRDRIFVAEQNQRIMGSLIVSGQLPWGTELKWFIVHPTSRSKGIGRNLLESAIQFAQMAKLPFIYGWVLADQADAIKLYESYSFKKTDERKHNDYGKDIVEYRFDLRF
ncbi:MAG: GNAT family N-acetyltransferase [Chloroherpetonaceae bacterium]|nr:GNAT family N-acetyltransferase [Chloroherpetonaceae bacterium]